jgi:hypothetical protein
VDTGGRNTIRTNDVSLAYARARRDLGCRYTLGFYERDPRFDVRRSVHVEARKPGLRVLSPEAYSFPSKEVVREASIKAAYLLPSRYHTGAVRAHAFPVRPVDSRTWEALLVVEFPLTVTPDGRPVAREFGAVVKTGGRVRHRFSRRLEVSAVWPDGGGDRTATFVERVVLPEGTHEVVAVLTGDGAERPEAVEATVELPPVPRREPLLPPPVLGHEVGRDVVIYSGGEAGADGSDPRHDRLADPGDFRPVLLHRLAGDDVTLAMTQACAPKRTRGLRGAQLVRELLTSDGSVSGTLPDVPFDEAAEASGSFRCVGALDEVPLPSLEPGGYRFRATLFDDAGTEEAGAETRFERLP